MSTPDAIRLHKQAVRDLQHSELDLSSGYYEWACNSARQSGEKILKALFHHFGVRQPRGRMAHSVEWLLRELQNRRRSLNIPFDLFNLARKLDHIVYQDHRGQTCCCIMYQVEYFDTPTLGDIAPYEVIGEAQAREKIDVAKKIKDWAESLL